MAPEQARGKKVDRRADIWAFGVVLYEVLTGQRLFEGETISDILAQVLTKEPDWTRVPVEVRRLLQSCLPKDVKQRLQAIGDWRLLIEDAPAATAPSRSRFRNAGWVAASALAAALIAALALLWPRPVQHPLMRMSVDLGPDAVAGQRTTVAISPDGTRIVFPMRGTDGKQQLATRLLEQATPTPLPGTENAADPFFSPDGQWVGFFADGKLKKLGARWRGGHLVRRARHARRQLGRRRQHHRGAERRRGTLAYSRRGRNARAAERFEVYVRPFQSSQGGPGGKWQISTAGGTYSFWSRDGRELYYEDGDSRIMVVSYTVKGDSFAAGKPRLWSDTQIRPAGPGFLQLDLAPDGKRFAILPRDAPAEAQGGSVHVTFLLNFFDELRRRAPAR